MVGKGGLAPQRGCPAGDPAFTPADWARVILSRPSLVPVS